MKQSQPLTMINSNREWVFSELDKLREEWRAWAKVVEAIGDHPYNPNTHSDIYADGEANMRKHSVLQAKTLTFLNNNVLGHGFINGLDGNGCDRTDLRLQHRVKHRLHDLDWLGESLQYAALPATPALSPASTAPSAASPSRTWVFFKQHWQWIIGVILVPIIIALLQ